MLDWILTRFRQQTLDDIERARAVVSAADRGHLPTDSESIRKLARILGLAVAPNASLTETIQQIRSYLKRSGQY